VDYLIEMRNEFTASGDKMTASELQKELSDWGEKAASSGDFFKDAERAKSTRIAREMFAAAHRTLDNTKTQAESALLKVARETYKQDAAEVLAAKNRIFDKALRLKKTGGLDKWAKSVADGNFDLSEVRKAATMLEKSHPEALADVRAAAVDALVSRSQTPQSLVKTAKANSDKIRALFGRDLKSYNEFLKGISYAERIINPKFVTGESQTEPLRQLTRHLSMLARPLPVVGTLSKTYKSGVEEQFYKDLFHVAMDPEGVGLLRDLATTPRPKPDFVRETIKRIGAIVVRPSFDENQGVR
jgi:hypothetical protein